MPMIPMKNAVKIASDYLAEVFPDVREVRLEEVELAEEGPFWNITFSFLRPQPPPLSMISDREYKVVQVGSDKGDLHSIRIRKL